jgi:primosomal protein N''|tara:strand:- start:1267 stop:1905 length:639 start_codon:yes stop_codon:yes gene_type:complete
MIGAIGGVVSGLTGIASGIIGSKGRKAEQKAAQAEFNRNKARMEGADTSNLNKNVENTMEDLTVNTQAAEFQAQQQAGGFANTMDNLSGAAGGSGIAALAQSMAGAQSNAAQAASADIGRQEAGNQKAERQMAGQLQQQEIQGEYASRAAEKDKVDTMLGMSQQRLGAANEARDAATAAIVGGVGSAIGGAAGIVSGLPSVTDTPLGGILGA